MTCAHGKHLPVAVLEEIPNANTIPTLDNPVAAT